MDPSPVNPRILFTVAAVAAIVFTAIAIFIAAGYTPESDSREAPPTEISRTSIAP